MIGVKNIQGDGKYVGLLTQVTALQFYSTLLGILALALRYSIVKDSSADLGVNFKIVQNRPTVKAPKFQKKNFCIFLNIFIFLRENKEVSFFIF